MKYYIITRYQYIIIHKYIIFIRFNDEITNKIDINS